MKKSRKTVIADVQDSIVFIGHDIDIILLVHYIANAL